MFDISFPELLVIGFLIFIIFGPKKIPDIMRQLGELMAKLREMRWEIEREVRKGMRGEKEVDNAAERTFQKDEGGGTAGLDLPENKGGEGGEEGDGNGDEDR